MEFLNKTFNNIRMAISANPELPKNDIIFNYSLMVVIVVIIVYMYSEYFKKLWDRFKNWYNRVTNRFFQFKFVYND